MKKVLVYGCGIIFVVFLLSMFGKGLGWFSEAADVAKEEFGARASLTKYEWFKDASAQLEKKLADIDTYQQSLASLQDSYEDTPRKDWDRFDKQNWQQLTQELNGIKSSYNTLAAEYNANSEKFNWSIYKGSDVPPIQYNQYQ